MQSASGHIRFSAVWGTYGLNYFGVPWWIVFAPEETSFYAAFGNEFREYDISTGEFISSFSLQGIKEYYRFLSWVDKDRLFVGHGEYDFNFPSSPAQTYARNDSLWLFNIRTNKIEKKWEFPNFIPECGSKLLSISPGQKYVLLKTYLKDFEENIMVWDLEKNQSVLRMKSTLPVAFVEDENLLLRDYNDQCLNLTDLKGEKIRSLPCETYPVTIQSWNGKKITACTGKNLFFFDLESGKSWQGGGKCYSARFSKKGDKIVAVSWPEGEIKVMEASTGKIIRKIQNPAGEDCKFAPEFSSNATYVAYHTSKGYHIINTETGEELFTRKGHKGKVNSIAFSYDGSMVLSVSEDKTSIVWDARTGRILRVINDRLDTAKLHPLSNTIFTSGKFSEQDLQSGQIIREYPFSSGATATVDVLKQEVLQVQTRMESDQYGWSSWDTDYISLNEMESGKERFEKAYDCKKDIPCPLSFASNRKEFYRISSRGEAFAHDRQTGEELRKLRDSEFIRPLFINSDEVIDLVRGKILETTDLSDRRKQRRVETGGNIYYHNSCSTGKYAVAFSGAEIILADMEKEAILDRLNIGEMKDYPACAAFSPDCSQLIIGTQGGVILKLEILHTF